MLCLPCLNYDCYYCTANGTCIICNATLDYRVLNIATGRCIPLDTYYDDGLNHYLALPCDSTACLTCNHTNTTCFSCQLGKLLSGTTCITCPTGCLNCTSSTNCVLCSSGYTLVSGSCIIDCTTFLHCLSCQSSNNTVICINCASGYIPSINATTCDPKCGDSILITG